MIEISVDGINFYGSGDRGVNLPLLVGEVAPGESFEVYVRNRDNASSGTASDKNRMSYVEIVRSSS